MKKHTRFFFILLLLALFGNAQPGTWTWMKGDSTVSSMGSYGSQGVPSATNEPPNRYAPGFWTDTAGNFWLYGGGGNPDYRYNDLWKFDPVSLEWTWMGGNDTTELAVITGTKGVYNNQNWPGSLGWGIFTWVTADNHFWMFGGMYTFPGSNALWQFDPSINQWAWMGGSYIGANNVYGTIGIEDSLNIPGGRYESNDAWVDSIGNLWLYGGFTGGAEFGDLWEYDIHTGYWVCRGNQTQVSDYGAKGVPDPHNFPPTRLTNFHWHDSKGNFWLGAGVGSFPAAGSPFQDIWQYSPANNLWTWMGGPQGTDTAETSIVNNCDTSRANEHGGRYENRAIWKICDDLIINSGGACDFETLHTDIWGYIPSIDEWIKIAEGPLAGRYGTQQISDPSNFPLVRWGSASWLDRDGKMWLFGGMELTDGEAYECNDLWKYDLDTSCVAAYCNCWPATAAGPMPLQASAVSTNATCADPCSGIAAVSAFNGVPPYHYLWTPGNLTTATDSNLCAGIYIVKITDSLGSSVTDTVAVITPPPPVVIVTPDTSVICSGDTAILCATAGLGFYEWSDGGIGPCIRTPIAGSYNVTVTDKNDCTGVSNYGLVSLWAAPPVTISKKGDTLISSGAYSYQWYINGVPVGGATSQTYVATTSGTYSVEVTYQNGCTVTSDSFTYDVSGLDYLSANSMVAVWPNPSTGSWQVTIDNRLMGSLIEVFDNRGKLIYNSKAQGLSFELKINVAPGVYLLHIQSPENSYIKKLIRL
jgi:hypothetical protein